MVDELQSDWDIQLPHVESVYSNSGSTTTGLAPNKMHMGRLPPPFPTVFDLPNIGGHESLNRDHLAYMDLATARQQHAYRAARELHAIYASRLDHRNALLMDDPRLLPNVFVNGWEWIYNSTATVPQGTRNVADAIVLKTKLPFNWI